MAFFLYMHQCIISDVLKLFISPLLFSLSVSSLKKNGVAAHQVKLNSPFHPEDYSNAIYMILLFISHFDCVVLILLYLHLKTI